MKFISPALLIAQAVYLAFVPITIAHSIIVFSLAGLFAFNQFLLSQENPSLSTELAKLKSELEQRMEKQKESYEIRLKGMEDEVSRVSLASVRSPSSSSQKLDAAKKFQF